VHADCAGLSRDQFLDRMTAQGIGTGVHYLPIAWHPFYQERFGWDPDAWPHAKLAGLGTVSLPLSSRLRDEDVERVITAVGRVVGG
jgi:dTDP-4-amino-4,6-dideoxygalactose transaminase